MYRSKWSNELFMLRFELSVDTDAKKLHREGISDHAPITLCCSVRRPMPKSNQPISAEIFRNPVFAKVHDILVGEMKLETLSVVLRWITKVNP